MNDIKQFPKKGELYQCGACKNVFKSPRDTSEAFIEFEIMKGIELKKEEAIVVCDQCNKKLISIMRCIYG